MVVQACTDKHTIFGSVLVSRGPELLLIKDHEGDDAADEICMLKVARALRACQK